MKPAGSCTIGASTSRLVEVLSRVPRLQQDLGRDATLLLDRRAELFESLRVVAIGDLVPRGPDASAVAPPQPRGQAHRPRPGLEVLRREARQIPPFERGAARLASQDLKPRTRAMGLTTRLGWRYGGGVGPASNRSLTETTRNDWNSSARQSRSRVASRPRSVGGGVRESELPASTCWRRSSGASGLSRPAAAARRPRAPARRPSAWPRDIAFFRFRSKQVTSPGMSVIVGAEGRCGRPRTASPGPCQRPAFRGSVGAPISSSPVA